MEEEKLKEIVVTAARKYPGRDWGDLTTEEQAAVFTDVGLTRDMGQTLIAQGADMLAGAGKEVGPSNIYVNNPWEAAAGGVMSGLGYGMQSKARKTDELARGATSDMITRRDAIDEVERRRREEEERRRWQSLYSMFAR